MGTQFSFCSHVLCGKKICTLWTWRQGFERFTSILLLLIVGCLYSHAPVNGLNFIIDFFFNMVKNLRMSHGYKNNNYVYRGGRHGIEKTFLPPFWHWFISRLDWFFWIDFFALHKDILNMHAKYLKSSNQDDSVIMKSHYFVEREKKCWMCFKQVQGCILWKKECFDFALVCGLSMLCWI